LFSLETVAGIVVKDEFSETGKKQPQEMTGEEAPFALKVRGTARTVSVRMVCSTTGIRNRNPTAYK
jgi:hypothetical protein